MLLNPYPSSKKIRMIFDIENWLKVRLQHFLTPPHYTNSQNSMISFQNSWLLAKNLSIFVPLPWKLNNRYCYNDRSLICYNLTEKDIQFNLPTFAGRVTCMASNSVDSSILALGSGDGLIKVWKTASNKSMFEYTHIFQKGFRGKKCVLRLGAIHKWHRQWGRGQKLVKIGNG